MKKTALITTFLSFFFFVNFSCSKNDFQKTTRLAKSGDTESQVKLGLMYSKGQGVPQNYAEALKWYRKALEQDYVEATKWLKKAAEQGDAIAQFFLGNMYYSGLTVPQNSVEAMKWFKKAAEQGYGNAQYMLGILYAEGPNIQQNYTEAMKWFRKAADQGHTEAMFSLGLRYALGEGVPKDFIKAYMWWSLALAKGKEEAKDDLKKLSSEMTPQQIAQAKKEAAELWEKINKTKK